jgi:hypothetical protein
MDVIIGPTDSLMRTIAADEGCLIAAMPSPYLGHNGRPFRLAALGSARQEATLLKVFSAWKVI